MSSPKFKRQLREITEVDGNHVRLGGRWLLNLASNNYLGLANHPAVQAAAIAALERWGTGSGSSPLLSGFTSAHQEFLQTMVGWKTGGLDLAAGDVVDRAAATTRSASPGIRALLFPSGYSANLAALTTLIEPNAQVFADRKNHASLVDGLRLASAERTALTIRYFRHRDFSDLARLLESSDPERPRWIVTDSVFSMDGTCTRPSDLGDLVARFDARLLVDEAHATGVIGTCGAGLFSLNQANSEPGLWRDQQPRFAVVGTLSKALASVGGYFVGPTEWAEQMLQAARPLIYSTSLPASCVAAATAAIHVSLTGAWRRRSLHENIVLLHSELSGQGWRTVGDPAAPLLAVVVGDHRAAEQLADALLELGVWAPAIRPPTVKPFECRIRLSPTATMTADEIQTVITAFGSLTQFNGQGGSDGP
jgi:7-keto-8-aminopelargonate synthetase-like enzyme